jgi:hypothetical protein
MRPPYKCKAPSADTARQPLQVTIMLVASPAKNRAKVPPAAFPSTRGVSWFTDVLRLDRNAPS